MEKRKVGIKESLINCFASRESFTLKNAYAAIPNVNAESIRARIYENLGIVFERVQKGVYRIFSNNENCILLEGDGRNLSFLDNGTVDCIITDHPWLDNKSNKGGNRSFADYEAFRYTNGDFAEKARVLKDGSFLVEFLPCETEANYKYLYQIKEWASECGLEYYCKVPWKKGSFVSNTGRKSKNTEDVMIFSKGKARNLRPDAKKDKADPSRKHYMSGANGMLPSEFDFQPPSKSERLHQAEKPVGLIEALLQYFTETDELVLDQFAGSGVVGAACINKNRRCILIEKATDTANSIANRLGLKQSLVLEGT